MGYRVDERYKMVLDRTVDDLFGIMNVSLVQQAKDVVKRFMGRSVRTKDPLFWPAGMLMLGLVSAAEKAVYKQEIVSGQNDDKPDSSWKIDSEMKSKCLAAISAHLDMWLKSYDGKIDFVDDALTGVCFIRAYELTHEDKYKEAADKIAQFILTAPRDEQGTIIYNPGRNSANIFADGVGQVSMFMAAYTSAFSDSDIVISSGSRLDASKQIKNFFEMGVDKKSGLNYHGYSLHDNQKKGLLGWGRAFGWLYMGVAEAACAAIKSSDAGTDNIEKSQNIKNNDNNDQFHDSKISDDKGQTNDNDLKAANNGECRGDCPDRKRCFMNSGFNITGLYRQMSRTALEYQRADGGWSWQIQGTEGHIDMSATGMIAYSLARGYNAGILDNVEDIDSSFDKAAECMLSHTEKGAVFDALSSCDDFGVHYQTYGHYPWGQGAVLAALAEIR